MDLVKLSAERIAELTNACIGPKETQAFSAMAFTSGNAPVTAFRNAVIASSNFAERVLRDTGRLLAANPDLAEYVADMRREAEEFVITRDKTVERVRAYLDEWDARGPSSRHVSGDTLHKIVNAPLTISDVRELLRRAEEAGQ